MPLSARPRMPCYLALFVLALACALAPRFGAAHEVNKSAIVLLVAKDSQGQTLGTGTGFIVKPEGVLVTNYHVLVDAAAVAAILKDGREAPVQGILHYDRVKDFAVLKLEEDFYSTLELGDSNTVKDFEYNSALGYLSDNLQVRKGQTQGFIVQTYGFTLGVHPQAYPDFPYIYTTASFSPGFSGGPVVDSDNRVIGLATVEGRSINLALPINYVKPHLQSGQLTTFNELRKMDRNAPEAHYYRGNYTLYVLGDSGRAIPEFQKALRDQPDFALAHYDLAAAYASQGNTGRAIEEYRKAIEINPEFPEALSNLGGYYFREGELAQARDLFQRAIQAYPNFIQALSNLGTVLNKLGKPEKALPHLKKTLRLDPEFGVAQYNLGNAHFALNHWDKALAAYNEAVALGVDFLSLHWKLFEIHRKKGEIDKAVKQLRIILRIDPRNSKALEKFKELGPQFAR